MLHGLLTASIVNKEALLIARAFPRDPDDGLFAYRACVDAGTDALVKPLDDFAGEHLAPAMLAAWDDRGDYPDTPLRLSRDTFFDRTDMVVDTYSGFTARTYRTYDMQDGSEHFIVEVRVGDGV